MNYEKLLRYSLISSEYENLSIYEQRRYLTFSIFLSIALLLTFFRTVYINFLSPVDYEPIVKFINTIPFAFFVAASFFMNAKNYKTILTVCYLTIPFALSIAHYYTADKGLEYIVLLFIIFSFLFFDTKIELFISFIYNSIHFISISERSFFYLSQKMKVLPYDGPLFMYNIFTGSLLIFASFYVVKMQVWKYEKIITDRTKDVEEQNTLKDKVFSTIAHDLRSPIAGSLTLLKALENNTEVSLKDYKSYIPDIRASVEETDEIIFDLLTWAKNELQKSEPILEPVSIKQIAEETIKELSKKAQEKKINLISVVDEKTIAIADKNAMKIVLRNLISNAIKFTASGGTIHIQTKTNGITIDLMVEDNGVGIAPEKIKLLFKDNFYTSKGTNNESGTGLGLIICDSLVKKSKGLISVLSTMNVGTTFKVSLQSMN